MDAFDQIFLDLGWMASAFGHVQTVNRKIAPNEAGSLCLYACCDSLTAQLNG